MERSSHSRSAKVFFVCLWLMATAGAMFAQTASSEMQAGVTAYKGARYEEAIQHFERAVQLDPSLVNARLYLAAAYMSLYNPGADSPDSLAYANKAIAEFKRVVDDAPPSWQRMQALHGEASLYFQMKRFDAAADLYRQIIDNDPKDAGAYYSLAVIDWMQAYEPDQKLRAEMNLKPTDDMPPGTGCNSLRSSNQANVDDGIHNLEKALEIRPDYDDAMAYMNLLYRQKAEYECDDPEARAADVKTADEWVDRTMEIKKAKAEQQRATQ
jgi:tetratricopeptide (TPR) repeat protein